MRVPWEQSEAVLFGPAGEETGLGFDPSMASWPLDQEDIATIITNKTLSSVDDYIGAIGSESVRGFHTIELLLFKDGRLLGRPFVGPRSQADIREYLSANGVL